MKLNAILGEYLENVGGIRPTTLGGNETVTATAEKNAALYERLARQSRYNTNLVTLIIVLQCVIFALGVALILMPRLSGVSATVAGAGSVGVLYYATRRLQQLWAEKSAMDLLLAAAPDLPPSETVKLVQAIYFRGPPRARKKGSVTRPARDATVGTG